MRNLFAELYLLILFKWESYRKYLINATKGFIDLTVLKKSSGNNFWRDNKWFLKSCIL